MPELPKRRNNTVRINEYKLSNLNSLRDDELKNNITKTIYIESIDELNKNIDLIKKLFSFGYNQFYSKDYNVLKYMNDVFDEGLDLSLLDDFENKDRSYINIDSFEKSSLIIPLSYVLWTNGEKEIRNHQVMYSANMHPWEEIGTSPIKKDDLKRIKDEVYFLNEKCKNLDEVEKTIIVSDYLQDRVQYIDAGNVSISKDGMYITKGRPVTVNDVGNISNVLFNKFGVCRGISSTMTILLNNPLLNVNIRDVKGSNHAWNVIKIKDKYYYLDNTWNITRNSNKYHESLKAKSFSSEYLLFGENKALEIDHHIPYSITPVIEKEDYDRNLLDKKIKKLQYIAKYTNYEKPRYESHKKTN